MRPVARPEAVDALVSLVRVQLSGVLPVGDAPHVGLFGYPAFVANVAVAAADVHRHEDPARFRRCRVGCRQPGPLGPVLRKVIGRGLKADLRQRGPFWVKSPQFRARCLERARLPSALRPLPLLGIDLASAARLIRRYGLHAVCEAFGERQFMGRIGTENMNLVFFQAIACTHTESMHAC